MHNTTDYIGVNLKFRDRLFRILFADKKYALELYNAFIHGNEQSKMELQVQVLNINYRHNQQLMNRCPALRQYAILISKVKTYRKEMDFEDAVNRAVDECIEEGVLTEFLSLRRAEVMNAFLTEYDEEKVLADIGQERYEDGKAEGITEGEHLFAELTEKLISAARMDDLIRAAKDKDYRDQLYPEYGIKKD